MPDFRIVEIVFDDTKVYYRYETVGASTIGGEQTPAYQQDIILNHFRSAAGYRGSPTKVESAALVASKAVGRVVQTLSGSNAQARSTKNTWVTKAHADRNYEVLNTQSR
ncbi:hypothetical protein [Pseudomonas aeruginosa]|uniref:hypothetical protein n=1 Tax=Pseudomonas aeruginosa TaxID=287 RepID=UPI001BD29D4B|nr:hypothetical protein [Pseudomonas aeruginosa]MBS9729452.1 hypothetical protein [Pseudomonas aeruginosa]MCV0240824.1 hypothetical protein [Pseudomonas aeruginosa]